MSSSSDPVSPSRARPHGRPLIHFPTVSRNVGPSTRWRSSNNQPCWPAEPFACITCNGHERFKAPSHRILIDPPLFTLLEALIGLGKDWVC